IQLAQSPFLNMLSEESIRRTLELMKQPPDAVLTPQLARAVCERSGGAAVLNGSIAPLGSQFLLMLSAKDFRTGDVLAQSTAQATRKEDIPGALTQIAIEFRTRVGESLATVQKYATPMEQASTSSFEALQAFSTGMRVLLSHGNSAAIPHFQRAVELDAEF